MAELGETTDPQQLVPGNPEAIEANVRMLDSRGRQAVDAAIGLRAIDTGAWSGPAADAFHDEFSYEPKKWYEAGDALTYAGEPLGMYAATLRWAQGQAREAIALWEQAVQETKQAKEQHDAAVANAQRQNESNAAAGDPTCVTVAPLVDPGEQTRQAAWDALNRARQQVQQVGDEAAQALRDLTPVEEETTLSGLGHGALDIAGLIPGVGELADGANAAWYAGEGRYTEAAMAGAAAVPFAGWLATGAKAADRASDATKAARHVPTSSISGRDLNRSLASESQVTESGTAVVGAGTKTPLRVGDDLAKHYGGEAQDWAKMTSKSYTGADGRKFETHWYENARTGERVEFKTKFTDGQ